MFDRSKKEMQIAKELKSSLILNPVENLPGILLNTSMSDLEGLYITDKNRSDADKLGANILFGGRERLIKMVLETHDAWNELLGSADITFRVFSGLHAHMSIFQSIASLGDEVLLLPEQAGGHYATPDILQRLGLRVSFLPVDYVNHAVDIDRAVEVAMHSRAKFLFVDRSEGLNYEDFSELCRSFTGYKIFDASQYLSNILFQNFENPFDMGFDMVVSTTHKNFPGPQHALICVRDNDDDMWASLMAFLKSTISNIHAADIIRAGLILKHPLLPGYASEMLENAATLERLLREICPAVIPCSESRPRTHHLWIGFDSNKAAMAAFNRLEHAGLLVNYRKLPYGIGYGLRIGTAAATLQGMNASNAPVLANAIAAATRGEAINTDRVREAIIEMKAKSKYGSSTL